MGLGTWTRTLSKSSAIHKKILQQLNADERTIELGMAAALLHDIGLSKGDKKDHAIASSEMFVKFIKDTNITKEEEEILRHAIRDHSNGNDMNSLVGLALVLADKLDATYHRVENSSIHDTVNNEFNKIKNVNIEITDKELIVGYTTEENFDINIVLESWTKAIAIPQKIAKQLNKEFRFYINEIESSENLVV